MNKLSNVERENVKERKKFKVPHSLVIILAIIFLATVMTWIVPAGEFARVKNSLGLKVIKPDKFKFIASKPVSPLLIPKFIIEGLANSVDLFILILMSGAAFDVIATSGALHAAIAKIAKKFSSKESVFIPILTTVFALLATTQGVNTFIAFTPITVMLARAMGFDSIVGAAVLLLGGAIGFATGTLNPSTTIVSQQLAGLPLYSGLGYRSFCLVTFLIVTNIYLIKYAKKVRKNPELSPMYDLDINDEVAASKDLDSFGEMNLRNWLVVLSLVGTLSVVVYGGIKLHWGLSQTSMAFIWLGIISGTCAGFDSSKIATCFVNGAKKMIGAALIIGFARAITGVLTAGAVIDTIVYGMGSMMHVIPSAFQGVAMYIANLVVGTFIVSGSGHATAVMPIFVPIADMVGLKRQVCVLSFNLSGLVDYVLPMSTALMGNLGVANIPYDRWMKFMWKLFLIWTALAAILTFIAQLIHLGPI